MAKRNFRQAEVFAKGECEITRAARDSLFLFSAIRRRGRALCSAPFLFVFSVLAISVRNVSNSQALQLAEKLKFLSFRGALRAEESLFLWKLITEGFLASL
jgi:hypothetical protein